MVQPAPASAHGQKLTDGQRAAWARSAGFPEAVIQRAVAVSIAENDSGAIDRVSLPNFDGSRDYGMWQINDRAHPDLFARYPEWWSASNAIMAYEVWKAAGNSFTPWTTYKNNAFQLYLGRAAAALHDPAGTSTGSSHTVWPEPIQSVVSTGEAIASLGNTVQGVGNGVKDIASAVFKAGAWMAKPDSWARVAQVVIGGGLLIAAITVVLKPVTKPVADAVLTVAGPAAGAGKATASKTASKPQTSPRNAPSSKPQTSTKGEH